jgi:hypothetical protein
VKLRWSCGVNVDWGGVGIEPGSCAGEGVVHLTEDQLTDWYDDLTPNVQCDRCETVLTDPSHYSVESLGSPRANPEMDFEAPYSEETFDVNDHVLYEGGVWKVVKESADEFDVREQKLDIKWIGGPRMGGMVYATGVRASEIRSLTDMEVIAFSSMEGETDC